MESAQDFWQPYEPTAAAPWNRRRAVHLHRRAAFGATWAELERDLAGGPQDAVARLLAGQSRIDACPSDFDAMATMLADAAIASQIDARVKAAWVYRMFFSPDPLGERLTLTWHNHFATSNRKVQDLRRMWRQNEQLRGHARARFETLLAAAVHSPAMLVWLDADKNHAAHPNENLARELLELFTVGIGKFTEEDVRQSARALTGWKVTADEFRFDQARHDAAEKTIFGNTGSFDGDQLLALLAAQGATARRLSWRLTRMLMAEGTVDEPALAALADGLRQHDLDVGWGVETILRSRRFFAAENLGAKIIGPAEYVVGSVRALERFSPPASTLLMADWMARMGQDLFYPPNVGGWPEGRTWLASGAIVARANFAAALVEGRLTQSAAPPAFEALVARHAGRADTRGGIEWLAELLYGGLAKQTIDDVHRRATSSDQRRLDPWSAAVLMLLVQPDAHLG